MSLQNREYKTRSFTDYYNDNYEKLKVRIEDLDRRIAEAIETIPPENRKLLTYHDSFPFFGSRYGMEIIGAVQPSGFSEPSAREVANLIDQVRETGCPPYLVPKSSPAR